MTRSAVACAVAALALTGCAGAPGTAPSGTSGAPRVTSGPPAPVVPADPPAAAAAGGLPDERQLARARADVAGLPLEQLAGQLVVASYAGSDAAAAAAVVRQHHLGGVITLGGNVPEVDRRVPALRELTAAVEGALADDDRDWPAFLGVDQEGGPITRIGAPLDRWPAAMALGAAGDPALAAEVAQASGEQLRALGYTVVFAPDADVTAGPQDPTIGARSPGSDPALVAGIASAQAGGYAAAGLVPVAKHFPGHGSVAADTHLGAVAQPADLATLHGRDLVPFRRLADDGIPAVMSAHIVLEAVDPDLPATLSPEVLTGLLRDELGFDGLVVTDALNMGAVTQGRSGGEAVVQAVLAGADVLLMPVDPGAAVDALVAAVGDGTLDRERLEESAARMVATLRHAGHHPRPDPDIIGSRHELAVRAAGAALTQLSGPCGERLVGSSVQVVGGTEGDRRLLTEVADAAGLGTGAGDVVALVGAPAYQAGGGGGGAAAASGDVVVALDVPYPLADSAAGTALLAAYGRDRATFEALVQVLLGEEQATGELPVVVGGHPVGAGCGAG